MNFGDDDVGRTVGIEDHPPPGAAGAAGLGGVEKERIDAEAGRADIVDGAAAGAEAGPGLLPLVLEFEAVAGRTRLQVGDDQHRRRSPVGALRPTKHLAAAGASDQDAELVDLALWADLPLLVVICRSSCREG